MVNPKYEKLKITSLDETKLRKNIGLNAQKKRRKKNYELEIQILKHIIKNGPKSPFGTSIDLNVSNSLSSKTFRSMKSKNHIHAVKSEKISGGERSYYNLTQSGVEWIFEKGNLSFEEFWSLLFVIYNEDNNLKKLESIELLIKRFEKSKKIERNYFFVYDHFKDIVGLPEIVYTKEKWNQIKPLLENEILKKSKNNIDEGILSELDAKRIITNTDDFKNKTKIIFSPFGDILLAYYCYSEISNMREKFKFNLVRNRFLEKYPNVFSKWDLIKKITGLTDTSMLHCFLCLHLEKSKNIFKDYDSKMKMYANNDFDEDVELLRLFYYMQKHMKFQIRREETAANVIFKDWAWKNNVLRVLFNEHGYPTKYVKILAHVGLKTQSKLMIKNMLTVESQRNLDMEYWRKKFQKNEKYDEFLTKYFSEPIPDSKTIKTVMKSILPISKHAELYNFMMVRDEELYLDRKLKKFFSNDIYKSLYNIMSFQFFVILKLGISHEKWNKLMNRREMKKIKKWFDEWVEVITNYYDDRLKEIRSDKRHNSDFQKIAMPIYLETTIGHQDLFSNMLIKD